MTATAPALMLVAQGTREPDGQRAVRGMVEAVAAARPAAAVRLAWIDDVSPSPAAALAALADGAPGRAVVVLPLLLSAATHAKTDLPGSVQAARPAHPALVLRYGRPLGAQPPDTMEVLVAQTLAGTSELVEVVWQRHDEALAGRVAMSCGTGLYRTPYPGLADRVGAAQRPDSHPDDG